MVVVDVADGEIEVGVVVVVQVGVHVVIAVVETRSGLKIYFNT